MHDDWTYLRKELDRLEGSRMTFGSFKGWRVEAIPREYLDWCIHSVPLCAGLRRSILRVLNRHGSRWPMLRPQATRTI